MADRHHRAIASGRSNRSARAGTWDLDAQSARRPATSGSISSSMHSYNQSGDLRQAVLSARSEAIKRRVNDPLSHWRPYSPPETELKSNTLFPPMLPKSIDPTVPPVSARPSRKPPLCPPEWLEKSSQPQQFDASTSQLTFPDDEKRKVAREFVERNRDRLWKYDLNYLKKTPRTVCDEIVHNDNFLGLVTKFVQKERNMKLSSSENTIKCLQFPEESPVPAKTSPLKKSLIVGGHGDPFMASWTTTRSARDERVQRLFRPAIEQRDISNVRGFAHEPEFGTFSRYNAILKTNKGSLLDR